MKTPGQIIYESYGGPIPWSAASGKGAFENAADAVRKELLKPCSCGVAGHFHFQMNGNNCIMCDRESLLASRAKESVELERDAACALRDAAVAKLQHLREVYLREAAESVEVPLLERPRYSQVDVQPLIDALARIQKGPPMWHDGGQASEVCRWTSEVANGVLTKFIAEHAPFPMVKTETKEGE